VGAHLSTSFCSFILFFCFFVDRVAVSWTQWARRSTSRFLWRFTYTEYVGLLRRWLEHLLVFAFWIRSNNFPCTFKTTADLELHNNKFTGTLPKSMQYLTNLRKWQLWSCKHLIVSSFWLYFRPTFVLSYFANSLIGRLTIDYNKFEGSIPPEFGKMTNLEALGMVSAIRVIAPFRISLFDATTQSFCLMSFCSITATWRGLYPQHSEVWQSWFMFTWIITFFNLIFRHNYRNWRTWKICF